MNSLIRCAVSLSNLYNNSPFLVMFLLILFWMLLFVRAVETPLPHPDPPAPGAWAALETPDQGLIRHRNPAAARALQRTLTSAETGDGANDDGPDVRHIYIDSHSGRDAMARSVMTRVVQSGGAALEERGSNIWETSAHPFTRRILALVPAEEAGFWTELAPYGSTEHRGQVRSWLEEQAREPAPAAVAEVEHEWTELRIVILRGRLSGDAAHWAIYLVTLAALLPLLMAGLPLVPAHVFGQISRDGCEGLGSLLGGAAFHHIACQTHMVAAPLMGLFGLDDVGWLLPLSEFLWPLLLGQALLGLAAFSIATSRPIPYDPFNRPRWFVLGITASMLMMLFNVSPLLRL